MKKLIILIILINFQNYLSAQRDSTWCYDKHLLLPTFGYLRQGINSYEFGQRPFGIRKNRQTFSAGVTALFFKEKAKYISPGISARWHLMITHDFGMAISTYYWHNKVLGVKDDRITPELGISFLDFLNISYGYNIPIGPSKLSFIAPHRLALRIIVW